MLMLCTTSILLLQSHQNLSCHDRLQHTKRLMDRPVTLLQPVATVTAKDIKPDFMGLFYSGTLEAVV